MSQTVASVGFDTNIEDVADAQIRYLMYTSVGKGWRRKEAIIVGVATAVTIVVVNMRNEDWSDPRTLIVAAIVGLVFGLPGAWISWLSYTPRVKHRVLRMLKGELGAEPFRCEIDLTPEGVVTRQKGIVLTLPWAEFIELAESPAGVELHFRGSYVMARARAFATPADRAYFIDSVGALTQGPPAAS